MQMLHKVFKVAKETTPQRETTATTSTSTNRTNSYSPNKKESGSGKIEQKFLSHFVERLYNFHFHSVENHFLGFISERKAQATVVVVFTRCGSSSWRLTKGLLGFKNFNPFATLSRKDIGKTFFYTTLDLKRLGSFSTTQQHCANTMKIMKKEDIARGLGIGHKKDDTSTHAGNKVLPVSEGALSSSRNSSDQCGGTVQEINKVIKVKGDKAKTLSRMKELLKWAAAAKAHEKGGKYIRGKVLQFKNRGLLKAVPDDDQLSNDSPKISFRWELESCSTTTSSVHSALSMCSSTRKDQIMRLPSCSSTPIHDSDLSSTRPGNWITTDTEFVVLEL